MKTTDTALLGHVSARALSASALSDLWTMCSAMLVQGRVLSILVGGALGAGNPKLAGTFLVVWWVKKEKVYHDLPLQSDFFPVSSYHYY
jgi:Na+-driven multidrug efflux pump